MGLDCGADPDTSDTASGTLGSSGRSCVEDALDAIDQLTQHYDWAFFGVVGTPKCSGASSGCTGSPTDEFYPIAPVGSSHAEVATALTAVTAHSGDIRNLGSIVASLFDKYFDRDDVGNSCATFMKTSEVAGEDFCNVPVTWACQENRRFVTACRTPAMNSALKSP